MPPGNWQERIEEVQQISKRIFYNGSRRDREAKRHKWAEWKRDDFKTAASKAHKFAKLPEEWKPPSAQDLRKQMATEVVEIHKYNSKYKSLLDIKAPTEA